MTTIGLIRGAALSLAALGIVLPQAPVLAQQGTPSARIVAKSDSKTGGRYCLD